MKLVTADFLEFLIAQWFINYTTDPERRDYTCNLPKKRRAHAHLKAFECCSAIYRKLSDPSPFKIAACVCWGILEAQPLQLAQINNPSVMTGTVEMSVLKDNARLAIMCSLLTLDVAKFSCAPDVQPPHDVVSPSWHFFDEFTEALAAGDQIKIPGIALILESIFYLTENGKKIRGKLDGDSQAN